MKSTFATRSLCRLMVVAVMTAPMTPAMAGMVGTGDALAQSSVSTQRSTVLAALNRGDVAAQLQALGVDPLAAQARVASMTDAELTQVADQVGTLPAGAAVSGWVVAVVLAAVVWWYMMKR